MKANSRAEAWQMANEIFPTDYEKAENTSLRAGYDVYMKLGDRMNFDLTNQWISDLGNRLEINLANGKTINIWIEEPKPEFTEGQIADTLKFINEAIYQIDDNITPKMQEATGIDKARKIIYDSYKVLAVMLQKDYPDSKLYRQYNLKDA